MALRIDRSTSNEVDALAITGMDVEWQDCEGLSVFERQVYRSQPAAQIASALSPFQAAFLAAQRAWSDSGMGSGGGPVAVLTLLHDQPDQPIRLASYIAAELHRTGPVEDLAEEETSLADILHQSVELLEKKQAEAVLLVEYSQSAGAAALVFTPARKAASANVCPYATIEAAAECSPAFAEGIARTCQQALAEAGAQPGEIGYLEIAGAHHGLLASEEMAGLIPVYRAAAAPLSTAVGDLTSELVLPGVVKAALCLSRRFLPGHPGWQGPDPALPWSGSPFFVPTEPQAWFQPLQAPRRKAALSIHDTQDTYTHVILAEASQQQLHGSSSPLSSHGFYLCLLSAVTGAGLLERIRLFSDTILAEPDLLQASRRLAEEAGAQGRAGYCLALVGHDAGELQREAGFALRGVPAALEKNSEWQTPLGSYFTAQPQGFEGKVAFVYPGAFNSSLGIGRDLFYLFPELYQYIRELTSDVGASIRERQLYPRSLYPLSKEELQAIEASLTDDPIAMLTSGTCLGVVYTLILEKVFAIHPGAAFGYSLGENSLMYASGVWGSADQARKLLEASPLFHTRLVGPQETIRQFWGLTPGSQASDQPLWCNYLLMCPAATVQAALANEEHAYLTHINTPRQVVIGGDPQACERVIARLKCTHLKMPYNHAMHCPPVCAEFEELRKLHDWPVQHNPDFPIYLSADCQPVEIDREVVAEKIATGLTSCVDFAGLTRRAYQDGARIFVELGAGSNCSKWIDDTLRTEPHLSVAINRAGSDDLTSIVRLLARLSSHRVPVDLTELFTAVLGRC